MLKDALGAAFLILVGVMSVLIVVGACLTACFGRWVLSATPKFPRTRRFLCRQFGHTYLDALGDDVCLRCSELRTREIHP